MGRDPRDSIFCSFPIFIYVHFFVDSFLHGIQVYSHLPEVEPPLIPLLQANGVLSPEVYKCAIISQR